MSSDARLGGLASLSFGGDVIGPAVRGYDDARRVWNGTEDRRPGAIVRPRTSDDVVAVVRFAADAGAVLAVRGGGSPATFASAGSTGAGGALVAVEGGD